MIMIKSYPALLCLELWFFLVFFNFLISFLASSSRCATLWSGESGASMLPEMGTALKDLDMGLSAKRDGERAEAFCNTSHCASDSDSLVL